METSLTMLKTLGDMIQENKELDEKLSDANRQLVEKLETKIANQEEIIQLQSVIIEHLETLLEAAGIRI